MRDEHSTLNDHEKSMFTIFSLGIKMYPVSGVIGRLQIRCGDALYCFGWGNLLSLFVMLTGKYVIHVYAGTKFPIHIVWWLREASQIGQTFIPLCDKFVKNTARQNSNRSSNFGCNWTSFHSSKQIPIRAENRTLFWP